jgi:predicted metal-dependent peptidase
MITSLRRTDYRLYPFNKKHLWRGLYLPSVGEPGPEHIVLAVDTSASMDERELAVVLGEIDQLRGAAPCRITIVQADERVQRVESFEPHEPLPHEEPGKHFRFLGRGGTRFEPVFELVATEAFTEERGPPDALVYYTDGWADFPHRAPDYPVIWLITEDREHGASLRLPGRLRPRFGHIIPIAV